MYKMSNQAAGGVAEQLYSGAATFGHYYSIGVLVLGGVIALILFGVGINFVFFKKQQVWNKTSARVLEAECSLSPSSGGQYSCRLGLSFGTVPVNGMSQLVNVLIDAPVSTRQYSVGDEVTILYDANNPSNVSFSGQVMSNRTIGLIALGIGLVVLIGASFQYFIASSSKAGSAAIGAMGFWNLFR
jgi:hypothetical protein